MFKKNIRFINFILNKNSTNNKKILNIEIVNNPNYWIKTYRVC